MALTIFLARLLGLYCLIVALAMLTRRRETIATITAMLDDPGALMIAGVLALAGGLAIIIGHEVWQGGFAAIAVTLIGWVMTAKGAMLLLLPSAWSKSFYKSLHYERFFKLYMSATALLGLALLWASLA